ncbi:G5 domain-containing protein [Carnobacteriaceae bacterium zg-ZUI240]|nr:G5 domain-containing protein [Carnobacteriaceae bacterium zg-ZUI240]
MYGKRNMLGEKVRKYAIKKYSIGVVSACVAFGMLFVGNNETVYAVESNRVDTIENSTSIDKSNVEETTDALSLENETVKEETVTNEKQLKETVTNEQSLKEQGNKEKSSNEKTDKQVPNQNDKVAIPTNDTPAKVDKQKVSVPENVVTNRSAFRMANPDVSDVKAIIPLNDDGNIKDTVSHGAANTVLVVKNDGTISKEQANGDYAYVPKQVVNDDQIRPAINALKAVEYDDLFDILQPRVRFLEKLQIQNDLKKEIGREPSEAEINARVKKVYMDKLDMRNQFKQVKDTVEDTIKGLLERSTYTDMNKIIANKSQILLGLSYLERQYPFAFDGVKAKDLILYHPEIYGTKTDPLDRLINIGRLTYADVELSNTDKTYEKKIKPITQQNTIYDFIVNHVKMFEPSVNPSDWFKQHTNVIIVETDSPYADSNLFMKMSHDTRLRSHLIPLLTVNENSLYAISTMSTVTYGLLDSYLKDKTDMAAIEAFKEQIREASVKQEAFVDFWYRISEKRDRLFEGNDILVIDTMRKYSDDPTESGRESWLPAYGENSVDGIRQFMAPFRYHLDFLHADGQATGDIVNHFLAKTLTDRGQSVYTHEITHMLDQKVWFNGYARRAGQGVEVYARGLFESLNNTNGASGYESIFNLNTTYELRGAGRTQNESPNRFQKESDLKEYMQGIMDVLYTLDYAESESILKQSNDNRSVLLNKVSLIPDPKRTNEVKDSFSNIDETTAASLTSINDFIDKGIVSGRLAFKGRQTVGEATPNGYHVVPLFEPIYAGVQNDAGSVGDVTFRRYAYELLAEYGYKNGMVSYLSNQYANDQEALTAILDDAYQGNLATFKKDMFKRRIDKVDKLKETPYFKTYSELQTLMDEAIAKDLAQMKRNKQYGQNILTAVTAVHDLKRKIFEFYLNDTSDFRSSIYNDVVSGKDVEETREAIPITTTYREDETLWADETRTENGEAGVTLITKIWTTENGVRIGEPVVVSKVEKAMIPTVVYRGTKSIDSETVTETNVEIPVTTQESTDDTLYTDETRTQEGQVGLKRVRTVQPYKKGVAFGDPVVTEEIITPMTPTIVYRGTKPIDTETITETDVEIPVTMQESTDDALYTDETRTEQGQAGLKRVRTVQRYKKGVPFGNPVVTEEIVTAMTPTIVYRGTKPIDSETVTETNVEIPVTTQELTDDTLYTDETRTEQGQAGLKRVRTVQQYKKGVAFGDPVVTEEIVTAMTPTVVYRGTKPIDSEAVTETNVEIPVTMKESTDDTLYTDETRTQEGQVGLKRVRTVQQYKKGVAFGDPVVTEEIITPMTLTIVYRGTKPIDSETVTETDSEIPVTTQESTDDTLYTDETRTQEGQAGLKRVRTVQQYKKGVPFGDPVVTEEIVTAMTPTIVYTGTKLKDQVEKMEDIPFMVEVIEDDTLAFGTKIVEQVGKVGQKRIYVVNGVEKEEMINQPIIEKVRIGKKQTTPTQSDVPTIIPDNKRGSLEKKIIPNDYQKVPKDKTLPQTNTTNNPTEIGWLALLASWLLFTFRLKKENELND